MVGYSFVQRAGDIALLQRELAGRAERLEQIALVAKIETQLAIRNLPELIVQGAGSQPMAVMIARGDLAVEMRLQPPRRDAGGDPVAVRGRPRAGDLGHPGARHVRAQGHAAPRAEITDAAMAERAECVMLNKGPYVADAITLLDDVLAAMEGHQFKKASRLRALRSW